MKQVQKILDESEAREPLFSGEVRIDVGDRRSRARRWLDRLPWSEYSRLIREWKRQNT